MAENEVEIGKTNVEVEPINNIDLFDREYGKMVKGVQDPDIKDMLEEYKDEVRKIVEAVNKQTGNDYGGVNGGGKTLVAEYISPDDFDEFGTTFERTYGSSGVQTYISGQTAKDEGFIIFGFRDPVDDPLPYEAKIYKGTEDTAAFPLKLDLTEPSKARERAPVTEARGFLYGTPDTQYKIDFKLNASGTDQTEPIGVYVKTNNKANTL